MTSGDAFTSFDPDNGFSGYLYMRVADHVEELIKARVLRHGLRLPAEAQMASELGVAIDTLRRAIRELRLRGLVFTLPAKGTYVSSGVDES